MKAISAAIVAVAAFVAVASAGLRGHNKGELWEFKEIRQQQCGPEEEQYPKRVHFATTSPRQLPTAIRFTDG